MVLLQLQGPYRDKDGRVRYYKKIGEDIPEQELEGENNKMYCVSI